MKYLALCWSLESWNDRISWAGRGLWGSLSPLCTPQSTVKTILDTERVTTTSLMRINSCSLIRINIFDNRHLKCCILGGGRSWEAFFIFIFSLPVLVCVCVVSGFYWGSGGWRAGLKRFFCMHSYPSIPLFTFYYISVINVNMWGRLYSILVSSVMGKKWNMEQLS